jgi:predicted ABC-class ATPase
VFSALEKLRQSDDKVLMSTVAQPSGAESYTVLADGHIVGTDGFVVPASAAEFHERFPRYIQEFVRRRTAQVKNPKGETLASILTQHMVGRLTAFDPERMGGASAPRYYNWLYSCLLDGLCIFVDER